MRSAVLLVICSCGSPSTPAHDGGAIADANDSSIDGSSDDAAIDAAIDAPIDAQLPVIPTSYECDVTHTATVRVRTVPNLGSALLLVHDVFGAYVTRAMSGTTGDVTLTVPGCGAVTIVRSPNYMRTITYVGDGDELWIEGRFTTSPDRGPAKIHVGSPVPNATYALVGPFAGDVPGPLLQNVYWHDEVLDTQDRVTVGFHTRSADGFADPQRWALFEDVRLADFQQTPLEVTSWQTASRAFQVRVTLPTSSETEAQLANVIRDHNYVSKFFPAAGFLAATTNPVYDFEMPAYGDGLRLRLGIHPVGTTHSHVYVERFAMPSASTIDRDLTNVLMPDVSSLTVTPAFDRPVIEWTVGAGDPEDMVGVGVAQGAFQWSLVLPPGVRRVQLPELPADVAHDFSALPATNVSVGLGEASDFVGYAFVRNHSTEMESEVRAAGTRVRISSRGYGPF